VVTDYTGIPEMIAHGMGDLQTVSALALELKWIWLVKAF
jgi:beta-glucosidase